MIARRGCHGADAARLGHAAPAAYHSAAPECRTAPRLQEHHATAARMIIHSLLDTDLYKFTMMQVVLHRFPGAQVEYRFKCRTPGADLRPHLDEMKAEFANLTKLRFRDDELAYL